MENIKEWENRCNEMLFDTIVELENAINTLSSSQIWKMKTIEEFDDFDFDELLEIISNDFSQLNVSIGQKAILLVMKEGAANE